MGKSEESSRSKNEKKEQGGSRVSPSGSSLQPSSSEIPSRASGTPARDRAKAGSKDTKGDDVEPSTSIPKQSEAIRRAGEHILRPHVPTAEKVDLPLEPSKVHSLKTSRKCVSEKKMTKTVELVKPMAALDMSAMDESLLVDYDEDESALMLSTSSAEDAKHIEEGMGVSMDTSASDSEDEKPTDRAADEVRCTTSQKRPRSGNSNMSASSRESLDVKERMKRDGVFRRIWGPLQASREGCPLSKKDARAANKAKQQLEDDTQNPSTSSSKPHKKQRQKSWAGGSREVVRDSAQLSQPSVPSAAPPIRLSEKVVVATQPDREYAPAAQTAFGGYKAAAMSPAPNDLYSTSPPIFGPALQQGSRLFEDPFRRRLQHALPRCKQIENLLYPMRESQIPGYDHGAELMDPRLIQFLRIEQRAPAPGDVLVLAQGLYADDKAPPHLKALARCGLAAYEILGHAENEYVTEFYCNLQPPAGREVPLWPCYARLSSSGVRCFLSLQDEGTLRTSSSSATEVDAPEPVPSRSQGPTTATPTSRTQVPSGDTDNLGIVTVINDLGMPIKSTKNTTIRAQVESESICVMMGAEAFQRIFEPVGGMFAHLLTAEHILSAIEDRYIKEMETGPTTVICPQIPIRDLAFYPFLKKVGFKLLTFEWKQPSLAGPDDLHPVYLLPQSHADQLEGGALRNIDDVVAFLRGMATFYSTAYNDHWWDAMRDVAEEIGRRQLCQGMDVDYVMRALLMSLNEFWIRTLPTRRDLPFHLKGVAEGRVPRAVPPDVWPRLVKEHLLFSLRELTVVNSLAWKAQEAGQPAPHVVPLGAKKKLSYAEAACAAHANAGAVAGGGDGEEGGEAAAAKKKKELCMQDLLYTYGESSHRCPRSADTCASIHHAEIRGMGFGTAQSQVEGWRGVPWATRKSVLEKMRSDCPTPPYKFRNVPDRPETGYKPGLGGNRGGGRGGRNGGRGGGGRGNGGRSATGGRGEGK